jgi:hypothetical protein
MTEDTMTTEEMYTTYVPSLVSHVFHNAPKINGWEIDLDPMSGSLSWRNEECPEINVCATLFYDGEEGVGVVAIDNNGNIRTEDVVYPLTPTHDVETDTANYVNLVTPILSEMSEKFIKVYS